MNIIHINDHDFSMSCRVLFLAALYNTQLRVSSQFLHFFEVGCREVIDQKVQGQAKSQAGCLLER